jgi:hypothetical protein
MNVKEAAFYFAEIMIRHFVFSIFIMAILAAHQVIAADVDPRCLVQGSPFLLDENHLYMRGKDNHLREWQREYDENGSWSWFVADLTTSAGGSKIMSDPRYFLEYYFNKKFDEEGNPKLDDDGNPILELTSIEHIVARGQRGYLVEWQRRLRQIIGSVEEVEELTPWEWSDLTKEATGGRIIAGAPSLSGEYLKNPIDFSPFTLKPLNGDFFWLLFFSGELDKKLSAEFFTTPTPNDHLLGWELPRLSDSSDFNEERVWSVEDLTERSNEQQTSAGNIIINYGPESIFTRSQNGHLLLGELPSSEQEERQVVDLTDAIDRQPTIVGDPMSYGNLFQVTANKVVGLQYVFARNSKGHLLEWRHLWEWEGEIPPIPEGVAETQVKAYEDWIKQIDKEWNATMFSGWEWSDLTADNAGKTIAGNPTVYPVFQVDKNAESLVLNVLARGDDAHLLKWSVTVLSKQIEESSLIFNEKGHWIVEDLTKVVSITCDPDDAIISCDKLEADLIKIEGDPIKIENMHPMTNVTPVEETPEGGDSQSLELLVWAPFESIFVVDENDHLLEWGRLRVIEDQLDFEGKDGTLLRFYVPPNDWQVIDLTKRCNPTGENSAILPEPEKNNPYTQYRSF